MNRTATQQRKGAKQQKKSQNKKATTTTPKRSIKTRAVKPTTSTSSFITSVAPAPTLTQSYGKKTPTINQQQNAQFSSSIPSPQQPNTQQHRLRPKMTKSSQHNHPAFTSSTALLPQSLHSPLFTTRNKSKPGFLTSWARFFSTLNGGDGKDNKDNKDSEEKKKESTEEKKKDDEKAAEKKKDDEKEAEKKKDGEKESEEPTTTTSDDTTKKDKKKEKKNENETPEETRKREEKERVEKENKEKREKMKENKDGGKWSSIPKMDSIKLNPATFQEMEPEKVVMLALRLAIGFFALGQIIPAIRWMTQFRSRNASTYSEIFTELLTQGKVQSIQLMEKTAAFILQDGKSIALDVISPTDFAARLAYDTQQLGLEIPTRLLSEAPDLHLFPLLLLLQLATLPSMLSKTKNLFPNRSGPKIKKVEGLTTRFNDVAGMDEAKNEIVEFVDFLREPEKYKKLGARLPKGALLSGPPGTGKTLLAKATAGEAGVSFYSVSGSEFQQMYVGMGAKRVRDLFKTARKNAPAIVFIDEIDSIAKKRSSRGNDGSSEREATLNQLLVEMDGFNTEEAVVVFAATNRAEMLDEAVTRAGRFDRKIAVSAPDLAGREAVFNIHLAKLQLAHPQADVAKKISALTPGMVGADIANVCNEAAIGAARRNNSTVELVDFESAVDKIVGGLEKKQDMNNKKQREVVAYHEAGHALMGWFLEHTDPLLKVTIIPRTNGALGFAQYLPKDAGLQQTQHLRDMIAMALGGRAAEDLVYNKVSTGASDDLRQVAKVAQGMILRYGMSKQFTNTAFATLDEDKQVWKSMSQKTNFAIDNEIMDIVSEEYKRAKDLLNDKRHLLEALGAELLAKETLNHDQLVAILGDRPFKSDHYVKYVKSRKEFVQDLADEKKAHEVSNDEKKTEYDESKTEDEKKTEGDEKKTEDQKKD